MALQRARALVKTLNAVLGVSSVVGTFFAASVGLVSADALANRITAPVDPARRCAGVPVPADVCERKRAKALQTGCVTQAEYQSLQAYGSFPSCDYDLTPPSLEGWCACGCFADDVRLLGADGEGPLGWIEAGAVADRRAAHTLATMLPESTLSQPRYELTSLRMSTKGAESEPLYVIVTEYGRRLVLTANHAILLDSGRMTTVRELVVGDRLVSLAGHSVPVLEIERQAATRDVVNFATEANDKLQHVLAAEGVLVGDLLWQASYVDDLNSIVIRQ